MPSSNPTSIQPSPRARFNKLFAWFAGISFVGFADSAYLTADHYFLLPLPCSIARGCETVLTSKYATVGPIPLALFGVAYYLAALALALMLLTSDSIDKRWLNLALLFGIVGFALSVAFESIQLFLIRAICQYCALSALCTVGLLIVGVMLSRASRRPAEIAAR